MPDVLLSGNHAAIARWRRKQALGRTHDRRPDLLDETKLSREDRQLLDEYRREDAELGSARAGRAGSGLYHRLG